MSVLFAPFVRVYMGGIPTELMAYILSFIGVEYFPVLALVDRSMNVLINEVYVVAGSVKASTHLETLYNYGQWDVMAEFFEMRETRMEELKKKIAACKERFGTSGLSFGYWKNIARSLQCDYDALKETLDQHEAWDWTYPPRQWILNKQTFPMLTQEKIDAIKATGTGFLTRRFWATLLSVLQGDHGGFGRPQLFDHELSLAVASNDPLFFNVEGARSSLDLFTRTCVGKAIAKYPCPAIVELAFTDWGLVFDKTFDQFSIDVIAERVEGSVDKARKIFARKIWKRANVDEIHLCSTFPEIKSSLMYFLEHSNQDVVICLPPSRFKAELLVRYLPFQYSVPEVEASLLECVADASIGFYGLFLHECTFSISFRMLRVFQPHLSISMLKYAARVCAWRCRHDSVQMEQFIKWALNVPSLDIIDALAFGMRDRFVTKFVLWRVGGEHYPTFARLAIEAQNYELLIGLFEKGYEFNQDEVELIKNQHPVRSSIDTRNRICHRIEERRKNQLF